MKNVVIGLFLIIASITVACSKSDVGPTPPPPVPACERNHTGTITVTNKSPDGSARTIHINGVNYGVVTYGNSISAEFAAGTTYLVEFYRSSNGAFIQSGFVTVVQCGSRGLISTANTGGRETLE